MKTLQQIREILADDFGYLEQEYRVKKIGVFDPTATDDTPFPNEVNILVEISNPKGWEYSDLHDYLENLLGLKVHVIATRTLQETEKKEVQESTKYI